MLSLLRVFSLLCFLGSLSLPAYAIDPVYEDFFGKAIKGYDPVAYFEASKPVKGDSDFTFDWNGATWYFASSENRDTFVASPEKYAPQYGGYCAWAVSRGYTAKIDPEAWRIHEGKLYLNYSLAVQQNWEKDIPGNIVLGDKNWPSLVSGK